MKFNPRIILFVAVALALIGFPAYVFLEDKLTGGVKDRGDFLEVNLKAMSNFDLDQEKGKLEDIPAEWRALNGKRVELTGEMYNDQYNPDGKMKNFELVYSIANCCYTSTPKIQHFVLARLPAGANAEMYRGLVKVTGKLTVTLEKNDEKITRIYIVDVDELKPTN